MAGGWDWPHYSYLSPAKLGLGLSLAIIVGGFDAGVYRHEILSFNSSLAWTVVGTLQEGRYKAAAAVVTFDKSQLDLSLCLIS